MIQLREHIKMSSGCIACHNITTIVIYHHSLQDCMVKCNVMRECIACAQIKRECFTCHGNITTGEAISVDNQPKFLVRRDYVQGYIMQLPSHKAWFFLTFKHYFSKFITA